MKPSVGMVLSPTSTCRPEEAPAAVVMAASVPEETLLTRPDTSQSPARGAVRLEEADVTDREGYLLPFEIISMHLLVVLVGAAYLARAKRRSGGGGENS